MPLREIALLAASGLGAIAAAVLPFVEVGDHSLTGLQIAGAGPVIVFCFAVSAALAGFGLWRPMSRPAVLVCAASLCIAGAQTARLGAGAGQTVTLFAALLGLMCAMALVPRVQQHSTRARRRPLAPPTRTGERP